MSVSFRSFSTTSFLAGLFWFTTSLAGQSRFDHVPDLPPTWEGSGSRYLEGLGSHGESQILITAARLQPLLGRELTGLALRRDGATGRPWRGGEVDLVVRLGSAARPVTAPGAGARDNLPLPVEVFRGRVRLPAMRPMAGPIDWSSPHVVAIPFAQGFRYQGGDLVVELAGAPVSGEAFGWPVDAVVGATTGGSVARLGRACGGGGQADGSRAFLAADGLVPGGIAEVDLLGTPGAAGLLALAAGPRGSSLELAAVGAPGCWLHVDPQLTLQATVRALDDPAFGGVARIRLRLPGDPRLLGAGFAAQWIEFGQGGLSVSEALDCRLAPALPTLGMALCSARVGQPWDATTRLAPRLRFRSRP